MDFETLIKQTTADHLISNLSSTTASTAALCELRLLSKSDPSIRPILATLHGGAALRHLSSALLSAALLSQDNAAAALLNISISDKHAVVAAPGVLDALSHALSSHRSSDYSAAAVQSAAATVFSLSLDQSLRPTLGSKINIVSSLIDIVRAHDSALKTVKDAVKALFGLSLHPPNRKVILELGGGAALFDRVVYETKNGRGGGVLEDVTAVIAQVAAFQGSPEIFKSVGGIRVLVGLIDLEAGGARRVRENAVSALLKLVEFGGEVVVDEIREIGLGLVLDGLRDVVHCGSDKGKIRADALMNALETGINGATTIVFSENGSGFGSSPLLDSCSS